MTLEKRIKEIESDTREGLCISEPQARFLLSALKAAKEALKFYAQHDEKSNLYGKASSQYCSDRENYRILEDKGTRAREVLEKLDQLAAGKEQR